LTIPGRIVSIVAPGGRLSVPSCGTVERAPDAEVLAVASTPKANANNARMLSQRAKRGRWVFKGDFSFQRLLRRVEWDRGH